MFTVSSPNGIPIDFSKHSSLVFILGPCAIESHSHAIESAGAIKEQLGDIPFIYKSSFDKANRSSISSGRGVGIDAGLSILADVREKFNVPVVTDIHTAEQAEVVASVVDMLQIPAFLCRQTDLIVAAAKTKKPVNVKKGQFLAPHDMQHVFEKAKQHGNTQIALCERGTTFGYGNLVVDMRGLVIMREIAPVVFDATHSVQLPGAGNGCSGGERQFVPPLACAAVALGISALFMEVHPNPDIAPCDGANMLPIRSLRPMVEHLLAIDAIVKRSHI